MLGIATIWDKDVFDLREKAAHRGLKSRADDQPELRV
jgi:hypothetical protein